MTPVLRSLATTSSKTPNSNTQHFARCSPSWQHMFSERNVTGQPKLLTAMLEAFAHRSNMFNGLTRMNNCRTALKCCSKLRFISSRCDVGNSIRSQLRPIVANVCLKPPPARHLAPILGPCGFLIGSPSTHLNPYCGDVGSSMHVSYIKHCQPQY